MMQLVGTEYDGLAWALASMPNLVFAATSDGRIVFVNAAGAAYWSDAASGTEAVTLFPEDARAHFRAAEAEVLRAGATPTFEWGEHGPGDVRKWFSCTLSPLRESGAITAYLCVSADVTELKRTELRLRRSEQLMVDTQGAAHLGTWEWDLSQPTATWSAELYRIYGLTPETYTPSYEAYLLMVHPDDRERVKEATDRVFHQHVPYSHDERIYRPDGSLRYLHTWAHPVLDEDGKLTRLVGVCQDITDQKLAEEMARQSHLDLERRVAERTRTIETSMRDLEAFNAMVSHDLRTPLSVIGLSASMIGDARSGALPPSVAENLERIQRSVVFMTELVNDLLELSRVGHSSLERADVDLSALSEEVLLHLRDATPGREVDVHIEKGLRCFADAALLRAAMENLIGNAWKYTSRTAVARIEIGAKEIGGRRAFFVRDNGAGFDMTQAHRLFAPFERLHTATDFAGTGIGLAAVQRIFERHGGRIWAESHPEEGATFFFELPAS